MIYFVSIVARNEKMIEQQTDKQLSIVYFESFKMYSE